MNRRLSALLATVLALLLAVPALAQEPDGDRAALLKLRRATIEELAVIGRQLDEVQARRASDDWVIVRGEDGQYVQVSLERVDELVPWVQMALADLDAAPTLLRAITRRDPGLVEAAEVASSGGVGGLLGSFVASEILEAGPELEAYRKLKAGDIEGVDSDVIRRLIRDFFASAGAQQHRAERYAAFEAQLVEGHETLRILLEILDAALEAEDTAPADEAPECTEADVGCAEAEDGGIEYDALEGLTHCDADDPDCTATTPRPCSEADMWCDEPGDATVAPIVCEGAFAKALEAPYTQLSVDQISACFDDCQGWVSWHGSMGDTLPEWCSDGGASG